MKSQKDYQQIQKYLDQQLRDVLKKQTITTEHSSVNHFQKIQEKLKSLQEKLIHLKKDQISQSYSPTQQHINFYQENQFHRKQRKSSSKKETASKQKRQQKHQKKDNRNKWIFEQTPKKQLKVEKVKSQALFNNQHNRRSSKNSSKKTIKYNSTSKKSKAIKSDQKKMNGNEFRNSFESPLFVNKQFQKSSKKVLLNKTHQSNSHIRFLEREVESSWKSNHQLNKRINQLKGYEQQFWKMKQVFEKCEKLRKKKL